MNKIDSLLDGTTIINLPFYIKLLKRYKKSVLLLSLLILISCIAAYFYQQEIYVTAINFSDASSSSSDPSLKILSAFLNEDKKSNKASEILNLGTSMDFTKKVMDNLWANPSFKSLRLDLSLFGSSSNSISSIIKSCKKNKGCVDKILIEKLPKFYEIVDRDRNGVNFSLQVKATDEKTANALLAEIMKAIQAQRVESIKESLAQQEKVNLDILEKKKKELEAIDYYHMVEEKSRLENDLRSIVSNIEYQAKLISEIQINLASAESKFKRAKKISKKKVNRDDLELEKKSNDLKEKIEKLTSDINLLENTNAHATEKDKRIIEDLKLELKGNKKQLNRLGAGNSHSAYDKFVKNSEEKVSTNELDFGVLSDQMKAAKESLDKLSQERSEAFDKKIKLDQKLEQLKPTIEFLKTLEAKIDQLHLLRATSISDMRFDTYETPPDGTKKIGKILMVAYCIVLLGIFNIILLTAKFLLDDRIYDENDLRIISEDLKVVGIGPYYD